MRNDESGGMFGGWELHRSILSQIKDAGVVTPKRANISPSHFSGDDQLGDPAFVERFGRVVSIDEEWDHTIRDDSREASSSLVNAQTTAIGESIIVAGIPSSRAEV